MAQVHYVEKRRVGSRGEYALRCTACGASIEYGKPYKWVKVKRAYGGVKLSFCPDCQIRHSHVSTSRMAVIWDAQRDLDLSGDLDAIKAALEDFAATVRDVAAEYEESVAAMEEGFGHRTYQADELEERAQALEAWADELESWEYSEGEPDEADYEVPSQDYHDAVDEWEQAEPSVDESEEDEEELDAQQDAHDAWEGDEPDERDFLVLDEDAFQAAVDEMVDAARDEAQSLADECPA